MILRRLLCSIFTSIGFIWSMYLMITAGMYFAEDDILFPSDQNFARLKARKIQRVDLAFHILNSTIEQMKNHLLSLSSIVDSQRLQFEEDLEIFTFFWSEIQEEISNVKNYRDESSCIYLFKNPCPENFRELFEICRNLNLNKIVLKLYKDYKNATYDTIQAQTGPFIFKVKRIQEILGEIQQTYDTINIKCNYEKFCVKSNELVISENLKDYTVRVSQYEEAMKKVVDAVVEHEETFFQVRNIMRTDFADVKKLYLTCLREFNQHGLQIIKNIAYRRVRTAEKMEEMTKKSYNLLKDIVPPNLNATAPVLDIKET